MNKALLSTQRHGSFTTTDNCKPSEVHPASCVNNTFRRQLTPGSRKNNYLINTSRAPSIFSGLSLGWGEGIKKNKHWKTLPL